MSWRRKLSSPVKVASQSPDGSFIATIAKYDRLVKVWRRSSSGDGNVQFDYSYLVHPSIVTALQWREKHEEVHNGKSILYTTCLDGKARIWANTDPHGFQVLQMWAEIDLQSSIQPRHLKEHTESEDRFVLFVNGQEFKSAIESVQRKGEQSPVLEHLAENVQSAPEVCLVLDRVGNMCAWGLNRIGSKSKEVSDIFNMLYVENVNVLSDMSSASDVPFNLLSFCGSSPEAVFSVILHSFGGSISWHQGGILDVFDPSQREPRFREVALWTGHEGSIKKIIRTNKGDAIISRTGANETLVWKQSAQPGSVALTRCSSFTSNEHIHRICLLAGGEFIAILHHERLSIWDATAFACEEAASSDFELEGSPLCLILLASPDTAPSTRYLATITSRMTGIVWRARLPQLEAVNGSSHHLSATVEQFCAFSIEPQSDLSYVLPVDPAGSIPTVSGFLDTFAKDVALSYTTGGLLCTWAAKVEPEHGRVDWLATAKVNTGVVNPSLASGSSTRKVALVDAAHNGLTIWDTSNAQLEYERRFSSGDSIQDLDWTSTPHDQSVLAVGFPHKVMVLAQIRYDYLDQRPSWASIREIRIRELTPHPIGDSTWLGNGSLVIGAGNQLFVYDKFVASNDENVKDLPMSTRENTAVDLFDVVSVLNGPLPIFHPQLLSQCILAGKLSLVQKVIVSLSRELKYYTEGDALDSSLSIALEECFEEAKVNLIPTRNLISLRVC